ncbi:hypothetical protein DFH07DRAFT_747536 [Mycena maculata]|uniref:Uncharacterized protein n=1 Tax=Mycena maculata TaxID=230809 RepID=A0AAD7IRE0_9AGAR|nr:hypothetical protein DFH07DRAFT_747536 [Mycena maculata]
MLASLRNYVPNRKKISSKSPFSLRKPDPASPHPYATQVFDIGDSSFEEREPEPRPSTEPSPRLPPEADNSPRVDVNIDLTPADWFPSHFLKTDSIAGPSGLSATTGARANAAKSADTLPSTDPGSEEEEEDDNLSVSSEDFVSNLEALDASDFVNLPTQFPSLMVARKGAPSPIKIPNASLHGPKVQIVRSAASQSRPESMFSLDGASAVSGTTLARALIGDSFVLSNDRSSRYRSGASVLTRSDSATLPHGDWSARKSGAFTPIDSLGFPIPPLPQMPQELRRVIAEQRDRLKVDESATKKSPRQGNSDAETPVTPRTNNSGSEIVSDEDRRSRRISRISEAPTPISSAPFTPDASNVSETAPTSDPSPNASSTNFHHGVSPSAFPTSPGQFSTGTSEARSSRDIDNVLDYYNFEPSPGYQEGSSFDPPSPDIPADTNRYQPVFSPITEESGSQLSSNSFRSRLTPNGKSLTPSPSTASGRLEWRPNEIRSLPPHPLLPIGDRPRSIPLAPAPIVIPPPPLLATSHSTSALPTLPSIDTEDALEPPSSSIFNRQRSGSAPSPIVVVRDPRHATSYDITVAGASSNSTPTTADGDNVLVRQQQTFPETPSAFSPTFSPGGESPSDRNSMIPPPLPGSGRPTYTSLAQQVLLTRAATTVRGARHSRQASDPSSPDDGPAVDVETSGADEKNEETPATEAASRPEDSEETSQTGHALPSPPPDGAMSEESASMYSPSVGSFPSPTNRSKSLHRLSQSDDSHWQASHDEATPSAESSSSSSLSRPSVPSPSSSPTFSLPPKSLSRRSSHKSTPSPPPPETTEDADAAPAPSPPMVQETLVPAPLPTSQPLRPPLVLTPPPIPLDPSLGSPHIVPVLTPAPRGNESPSQSAFGGFGSPPPYYTVMYDRDTGRDPDRMTPSTGGSGGYPDHFTPSTPSTQSRDQRSLSIQSIVSPGPGRRSRARPPLPIGPRRPSASATVPSQGRNRNGSVSSVASNMQRQLTSTSPRFQTPPLKWRGYTMDAAKWTFSSSQLQGIVSRAIRQSAEASSIRLLRMETVDTDIPEELHRLEMQRTDVKTRYKMLTRRRATLFSTLTAHLDGAEPEDPTYALRVAENLKEISTELDRLAEELHSADEQISQLNSLREVHSASALAMALRKLNASFLKQIAVAEALRAQVETLQAERDEAWTQAVDVANEYDDLNERIETSSPGPSSYNKRSSRVLAVKKSSIRVSKAGLRSSSRRSSVSSVGQRTSSSGLPSASIDIPPVPPIPRRRPDDILTDIPSRVSAVSSAILSTTPTSESRTLDRVQDELYTMLGISLPDKNSRKSHSVIMSAASDTENPILSSLASSRRSDISRPSSMPGSSALSDAFNAMTADRNAMLATLGMLDD